MVQRSQRDRRAPELGASLVGMVVEVRPPSWWRTVSRRARAASSPWPG